MSGVRVRFAPSPTGHLHVGNVRTALFNWLFARGTGGTFILRIEDTDVERSTRASEHSILADLRWLGLDWDEGPDVGGDVGPYRQSERLDRYGATARRLMDQGRAYYCFCSPAALEAERVAALAQGHAPKYGGRCRAIDPAEARRRVDGGQAAAIRFAVPDGTRDVAFDDIVRGPVAFSTDVIGDFVIVRSGGVPAYNFAVVVDDASMGITHVVRGEDHLSNTPRQVLLYESLDWTVPTFAHLSMVLGPDQAPLSKRHGATSIVEFRDGGFLPEALVNYLALLGWSPGENEELVGLAEMARRFDLARVGHSAAVFDTAKLAWINRHYMKLADTGRLARAVWGHLAAAGSATLADPPPSGLAYVESVLPLVVGAVDRLGEVPERLSFLFDWADDTAAALVALEAGGVEVVRAFVDVLAAQALPPDGLTRETFRAVAAEVRTRTGFKGKSLFHPLRVALTGLDSGPELDLAIPAIDRGAGLDRGSGLQEILSCAARARAVVARLS